MINAEAHAASTLITQMLLQRLITQNVPERRNPRERLLFGLYWNGIYAIYIYIYMYIYMLSEGKHNNNYCIMSTRGNADADISEEAT